MWKSVLKQMWNRKRSNTWIALELLFVFCLTWYIVDYLFVYQYNCRIPDYRDVRNTLQINIAELPEDHPEFREEENEKEALYANYQRIMQTIKNYPGVEDMGISYGGASPGSGNYWGFWVMNAEDTTLSVSGQQITIDSDYDFFKVFRYTTGYGKNSISTKDFDWGVNQGIVIGKNAEQILFKGASAIGKELIQVRNRDVRYTVMGVVDDIKRFNYLRPQNALYINNTLTGDNIHSAEISVRIKDSFYTNTLREEFKKEMTDKLRIGNFYFLSVTPYTKIASNSARMFGMDNNVKLRIYLMIFFLLNILLCVMGTFWYRINQRPNEIGLRKAVGATSRSIHNIMLMEGIWLLLIIFIPAMLIEFQFVNTDLIQTIGQYGKPDTMYLPDRTWIRFLITNSITFIFLCIVVSAAIWLPARKGASLLPAEALHHE